jgi:hypothetical protein
MALHLDGPAAIFGSLSARRSPGMTKQPRSAATATPATNLSTERVLLSCVASDTEWKPVGILVVIDRD